MSVLWSMKNMVTNTMLLIRRLGVAYVKGITLLLAAAIVTHGRSDIPYNFQGVNPNTIFFLSTVEFTIFRDLPSIRYT
jgi:hypothetical protein